MNIIEFPTNFKGIEGDQDDPKCTDANAEPLYATLAQIDFDIMEDAESFSGEEVYKAQIVLRNNKNVIILRHNLGMGQEFYISYDGAVGGPFTDDQIDELLIFLQQEK